MTITLELAPAVEERLRETAAREGLTVEQYLSAMIDGAASAAESEPSALQTPDRPVEMVDGEWSARRIDSQYDDVPVPTTPAGLVDYWNRVDPDSVFAGEDGSSLARHLRQQEEASRLSVSELRAKAQSRIRGALRESER